MKSLDWSPEKNVKLITERGFSFEDIQIAIEEGGLLEIFPHPNQKKYPDQQFFAVRVQGYVYAVPFVEREDTFFLKTAYPDRKLSKKYQSDIPNKLSP